ncbi:MAG TPA: HAMP domain-containing sensor histidine kinase [Gemmatimonadales bacterium]|nr:HAMP domain-containing sensor histidine kinase [Gemmatimonadales bacterium]
MSAETTLSDSTSGERRRTVLTGPVVPVTPWDPEGPTGSGLAATLWDALQHAVFDCEERWDQAVEHAASRDETRLVLTQVTSGIREAIVSGGGASCELPPTALARRLLSLIRAAFLERVKQIVPPPETTDLLRVLMALERVGQQLEPDWAQHFSDRLSGPDGLELVVEVAHDLRSPLTSILFLAETLQRGRSGEVNQVQERQLGLIYSAAFGLSAVASDVIELARGGDRLVDLDPIPFAVTDIFESVRDIVLPIAEEKGLEVRVDAPETDFRIGHPVALSRVLLNLTTNALKFTNEGHVEVVGRPVSGERIEFSVRDTGRGIPPHAMATLFEPFRRRQREGEYAFSGSGLGLSICRKLVEAMGSQLEVETAPEQGTRFFFELHLPMVRPAA